MATLTYGPVLDGASYDPVDAGGQVLSLELYATADRSGAPALTVGPATRIATGSYAFTVPDTTLGRYWPRVTWRATAVLDLRQDDLDLIDLPVRSDLAVSPETLAARLRIPLPLTAEQRADLVDSILDAQGEVEAELGRAVVPRVYEETRLAPAAWGVGGGWVLSEFPVLEVLSETVEIDSATGQETGYWTVLYRAGLDCRVSEDLRPIRRRILAQAAAQFPADLLWRTVGGGAPGGGAEVDGRRVKSVSAEGQSVTYEYAAAATVSGAIGASAPPWRDIDRWRLRGRRVFQRSGGGTLRVVSYPDIGEAAL